MRFPGASRLRRAVRALIPERRYGLTDVRVYSDIEAEATCQAVTELLTNDAPMFLSRVGGSDYEAVKAHFNNPAVFSNRARYEQTVQNLKEYNGYFDFEDSKENFIRFLEVMEDCYVNAGSHFYAGPGLIADFRSNSFTRSDLGLLQHVCGGKQVFDYTFVEGVDPFLKSFASWGEGRRVLVVSPFSRSVEHQYRRRRDLLVDRELPEFDLITYTTPITYNGAGDGPETMAVAGRNWHEECARMADEISRLDFDIALLSCASYSMYLGDFISRRMRRKAVYLGGMLNVFFNIYGQRYDTAFFNSFMRPDTQIDAFENDLVDTISGGRGRPNEALMAYFGRRHQ